jgi:hypothetical protein
METTDAAHSYSGKVVFLESPQEGWNPPRRAGFHPGSRMTARLYISPPDCFLVFGRTALPPCSCPPTALRLRLKGPRMSPSLSPPGVGGPVDRSHRHEGAVRVSSRTRPREEPARTEPEPAASSARLRAGLPAPAAGAASLKALAAALGLPARTLRSSLRRRSRLSEKAP